MMTKLLLLRRRALRRNETAQDDAQARASDNRGLSLIELIIAFTLLAIISSIMLGFMVTSSNMYRTVSAEVSLQLQSQIVMAQLKEYIVDCNDRLTFDGSTRTLLIENNDGAEIHRFQLRDDNKLYYNGDELAKNVTVFAVTSEYNYRAETTVASVTVTLTLEKSGKSYTESQIIALRNETVSP